MGVFDKWTKKATGAAVESAKETLNDKLDTYSGIIKIGLTLGVIIFGSKKINQHYGKKGTEQVPQALPPAYPQQPIVINNYYDRGYIPNGRKDSKHYQKH